jgi:hypothetical protein
MVRALNPIANRPASRLFRLGLLLLMSLALAVRPASCATPRPRRC